MSETQASPPAGSSAPRSRLGVVLLISLIVNLFLIGIIATAMWKHGHDMDRRGGHGGPMGFLFGDISGAKSDMTPEDRQALKQMMMGHFKAIRPQLDNVDTARKALGRAIAETPYNSEKVDAAFRAIEGAQLAVGADMRAVMVRGFGAMSDAQRQRLGKIMEANADRDWRRKTRNHDDAPAGPDGSDGPDGPPPPPSGD